MRTRPAGEFMLAIFSGLMAATSAVAQSLPIEPIDWSDLARQEIDAACRIFLANHPGAVDEDDPGFPAQLESARRLGLAMTGQVRSSAGFAAVLSAFGNVLQDGHAFVSAILPDSERSVRQWPGFTVVWRGDGLFVHFSRHPKIPRGARVISCDGQSIVDRIRHDVFRFNGRPAEPGSWWVRARDVLIDDGNPFVRRPTACEFAVDDHLRVMPLNWELESGDELRQWRTAGYNGERRPIGLEFLPDGIAWISLPTFNPNQEEIAAYDGLLGELTARRAGVVGGRAVVVDLRHNQGGSSEWSLRVAGALWGRARVDAAMSRYFIDASISWRATAANEKHLRDASLQLREQGLETDATWAESIAEGMSVARRSGRDFFVEPAATPSREQPEDPPPVALEIPVYVITPGQCASACLDALDVFTRFGNTRLIGAPTSGDSKYMDVRVETLPSGKARVVLPIKMWNRRPRGGGEVYEPSITVTALDWSDTDFLQVIDADLAGKH